MKRISRSLLTTIINFFSRSRCSLLGGVITVILFPVLLVSVLLDMQGVVQNPYFGFLIYMVMGPLFLIGLLLLIGGALFCGKKEDIGRLTIEYIEEELSRPGRFTRIRRLLSLASILTFVTLFVVGVVTYTGFHYTESVSFCGQFCHTVMEPEYVTYRNSPHSQVACVQCHIGAGSEWMTKSKFTGVRQLFAVVLDTYPRPIPTPLEALRPERGTCEGCHRPEVFHGDKLYVKDRFLPDEANTHVQTVMVMRIGSGGYSGREAHGIHWHVSEDHKVSYSGSAGRDTIHQVVLTEPDGRRVVYRRDGGVQPAGEAGEQVMDCIDCHNRPTHVFLAAGEALDQKLITGVIPREIPFIKRQGLVAVQKKYPSRDAATRGIAGDLMEWYRQEYPEIVERRSELLKKAVMGVQQAYVENVFPSMNIDWQTYTSFTGHRDDDGGCFRCHNDAFATEDGRTITRDCDACHIILVEDQPARDIKDVLKGALTIQ